jgi:23S rRNA pseudouridine1911/1915/1917 synthase
MAIDPAKPFNLEYTVHEDQHCMRLDKYVRFVVPTISRTKIQNYNEAGRIKVNGESRPANWKVRQGDQVVLMCKEPEEGVDVAKDIPVEIIYEDEWLLAVNKQPGLIVHPVALHRHDTMMNALFWKYKDILPEGKELTLVNRIDQHTSGIVLVAKDLPTKRDLQFQFENRKVSKTYLAITNGIIKEDSGEVDFPLGPKPGRINRVMIGVRYDKLGKPSHSCYEVLERLKGYTLIRLSPKTGRQHQLRVHMSETGYPLAADHLYGENCGLQFTSPQGKTASLLRFALHAETLTFFHPYFEKTMTITAPAPDDFSSSVIALREGWDIEKVELEHGFDVGNPEAWMNCEEEENVKSFSEVYGESEYDSL